jgi:pimeloyl-ACP methyl ester carboxylesterase
VKLALLSILGLCLLTAAETTVDGRRVWYEETGSKGPTVVLIHGWTCDTTFWSEQVPDLAKQFRVINIDLPGHGKSDKPKGVTYDMGLFANAVIGVMKAAKADKAVLVGHSMGLPVIQAVAAMAPERVLGLVSVDGALFSSTPEQMQKYAATMTGEQGLAARRKMIDTMFVASTPEDLKERIRKGMLAAPEWVAVSAMGHIADRGAWSGKPVKVPVLALQRKYGDTRVGDTFRKTFPGIDYREMEGVGHFLMMEKPSEFNAQLSAWILTIMKQ